MARKLAKSAKPKRYCRVVRATVYSSEVSDGNGEVTLVCDSITGAEFARLAASNTEIVVLSNVVNIAKPVTKPVTKPASKRSPKPRPVA